MKKIIVAILFITLGITGAQAQKFLTKTGHIRFFSTTSMEDIEAHNHQVNAALDGQTGDLVFKAMMKSFQFEKALMQEHFNENYVESDKYTNSTFKGKVANINEVDFTRNGKYDVMIEGDLTIKDVTKKIKEKGTLEIKGNNITGLSTFFVQIADYNIKIPNAVANNIAKSIRIDVDVNLEKLVK